MQDSIPAGSPPAKPPSRLGLYLPFGLFLAVVVAWSGFWFYARYRTAEALDLWLSLEKTAGRNWSCDDRSIGGYPFRLEVTCPKPSFTGPVRDENGNLVQVQGALGGFTAEALVYDPNHLLASLASPLTVSDGNGRSIVLTWQRLRASVIGKPGALGEFALEANDLAAKLGGADEPVASAKALELHLRQEPGAEPGVVDFAGAVTDASAPLFDTLVGSHDPARLEVRLRADKLARLNEKNLPATLDAWREAGGQLQVQAFKLQKGAMNISATGQLALDPAHYPAGQLDTSIAGADGLLARFGLGGKGMQIGGVLGAILGGGKAPATGEGEPPGLRLSVRLDRGRAFVGPFGFALRPVY